MNKLEQKLKEIKKSKKLGLMTHVIVGYPSLKGTVELIKLMEKSGVDIIELQIPFSDPLADGPTIMKACEESIRSGTKVKNAFDIAKKLSDTVQIPLIFMAYYNTVFQYGVAKFCSDSKKTGIVGLIVPDMPLEEEGNEHFFKECKKNNLYAIRVIAPATTDERLKKNAKYASGFVYCSARQGTTGARNTLDPKLALYLGKVRKTFNCPIAVGFGISKKEHMVTIKKYADIAVIGSAIINIIDNNPKTYLQIVQKFLKEVMPSN